MENRDEFATKLEAFIAVAAALRKSIEAPRKESRRRYPQARFGVFRKERPDGAIVTKARTAKRRQAPRVVRATASNPPYEPKKVR